MPTKRVYLPPRVVGTAARTRRRCGESSSAAARTLGTRVERWDTPDGDFVDVHRLDGAKARRGCSFCTGSRGRSGRTTSTGFLREAQRRGWGADLLIFRGCGDELNRRPRFYHSGDTGDLAFALDRVLTQHPRSPIVVAGVSLGGNVLLKCLGERGDSLSPRVRSAAAMSVPFDLEDGARKIATGFSRVYDRHFLRTLREKARSKLLVYPGLFDAGRLERADVDLRVRRRRDGARPRFRGRTRLLMRSSSLPWLRADSAPDAASERGGRSVPPG